VTCKTGFRATGDAKLKCDATGELKQQGSCEQIKCTVADRDFPNATGLPGSINATQDHPVTCKTGFRATGDAKLKCDATGELKQQGSCEQIKCTVPYFDFPNAFGLPVSINATKDYRVTCKTGFKATGNPKLDCDATGKLTQQGSCEETKTQLGGKYRINEMKNLAEGTDWEVFRDSDVQCSEKDLGFGKIIDKKIKPCVEDPEITKCQTEVKDSGKSYIAVLQWQQWNWRYLCYGITKTAFDTWVEEECRQSTSMLTDLADKSGCRPAWVIGEK